MNIGMKKKESGFQSILVPRSPTSKMVGPYDIWSCCIFPSFFKLKVLFRLNREKIATVFCCCCCCLVSIWRILSSSRSRDPATSAILAAMALAAEAGPLEAYKLWKVALNSHVFILLTHSETTNLKVHTLIFWTYRISFTGLKVFLYMYCFCQKQSD